MDEMRPPVRGIDEMRRTASLRRRSSDRGPNISLGTVLAMEKLRSVSAGASRATSSAPSGVRTLMDIIQEEKNSNADRRPFKDGPHVPNPPAPAPEQPRMSLMELLDQTDDQSHPPGASDLREEEINRENDDEDEGDEGGRGDEGGGKIYVKCCVCMVRHKGAAFIPCGHTFCRLCSRELWVSRGNCPLCNGFILEILDIF